MELSLAEFALAAFVVLGGAYIRGFTGFGASLIWISGLTLVMDPDEAVPIIFMLEIAASAQLLPQCRKDVQWDAVKLIVAGVVVGTPLGLLVLLWLEPEPMHLVVSGVVFVSAVALASGVQLKNEPRPPATLGTGLLSGFLNGATAAGGPPVIVLFLGSPSGMRAGRASLIAFFGITDTIGIALAAIAGLVGTTELLRSAALLPAMMLGALIGARGFGSAPETTIRKVALGVLFALAVMGVIRAL